jgi:dipeptidyl aminopeptidase/acylaminoacyl peptidase
MLRTRRPFALAAAIALPALAPSPPAAAQREGRHGSFTLEQVMSAPFADELTAAPSGGALAWVFNSRGARNVWVATPPAYRARAITHYADDDGQEIGALTWTPDGRSIIYVRGGARNRSGERPNPAHLVGGAEQEIWIAPLDSGSPRRLAAGSDPAVSPVGDRVAFVQDGQLWMISLVPGASPARLAHTRGSAHTLRFSPDGSRLAFVSDRQRHSFIGIYDMKDGAVRFVDPSLDRDDAPVWSPDGTRLAFIRTPSSTDDMLFIPRREGSPWSIRVVDAATGEGREVWRASRGVGSVYREIAARDQLIWAAGDRLVFAWERDGWTHLYAVPVSGGPARLLTPGPFEVEHVSPARDGASVLYSSNQGDIDRRHIWRVAVDAGEPIALTGGSGIEWSPVMVDDGGAVAVLHSDARRPARPALLGAGGALRDLAPEAVPAEFPAAALVEPTPVILRAADGVTIHAQLFRPRDAAPGERHPAVVFFHGGSRRQMLLGWHYMYYYSNAYAMNQYLASRGYIVLSVNYRSGIGYGMAFREALRYGAAGASELQDVLAAGRWLQGRPDVDPARIGLWGGSYGGYLTALGLARASDLFAAGVDLHGVHDWNHVIKGFIPSYDSVYDAARARVAYRSSPLASISTWRSPVLLIHGDDDRNVPFTESVYLAEALRKHGVPFEQLVIPDEVHDFLLHRSWLAAYRAAADFFDRHLGARAPARASERSTGRR